MFQYKQVHVQLRNEVTRVNGAKRCNFLFLSFLSFFFFEGGWGGGKGARGRKFLSKPRLKDKARLWNSTPVEWRTNYSQFVCVDLPNS